MDVPHFSLVGNGVSSAACCRPYNNILILAPELREENECVTHRSTVSMCNSFVSAMDH